MISRVQTMSLQDMYIAEEDRSEVFWGWHRDM